MTHLDRDHLKGRLRASLISLPTVIAQPGVMQSVA